MRSKSKPKWPLLITFLVMVSLACTCGLPFSLGGITDQPDDDSNRESDLGILTPDMPDSTIPQGSPGDITILGQSAIPGDALVLIYSIDQNHKLLSAYAYNLDQEEIFLPAGRYYAEVLKGDGDYLAFSPLMVANDSGGVGRVNFAIHDGVSIGQVLSENDFVSLFRFMVGVDHVRLTYFEIVSNGFGTPLYGADIIADWPEVDDLSASFEALGDEQAVLQAALAFLNRAESAAGRQPGQKGLASIPGQSLLEAVIGFFSVAREDNQKAREDVLLVSEHMTYEEKAESFEILQKTLSKNDLSGVDNYDDFIDKVKRGEISDMRSVRRNLAQLGPLSGILQTINPDMNRPGLEIIHQVGVTAIERGAELYVEAGKNILTITFPGIDEGFDYADQAEEWINFIHDTYQNPMSAVEGAVWDQFEDRVGSQIKASILERFPDTPEEIADELVARIIGEMKTTIIGMGEQLQDALVSEDTAADGSMENPAEETASTEADVVDDTGFFYEGFVTSTQGFLITYSKVEMIVSEDLIDVIMDFTFEVAMKQDNSGVTCKAILTRVYSGQTAMANPLEITLDLESASDQLEGSECAGVEIPVIQKQTLGGEFFDDGSFSGNIRNVWFITATQVVE